MMKTHKAIEHFGSKTKLAKALGIASQAVCQWGEKVPLARAYQIEKITNGKLKVDSDPLFKQAS